MPFFATDNWVDQPGAVITPEREVVTLPATNLAVRQAYKPWRVSGLSSDATAYCDVDFGENRSVQLLALFVRSTIDGRRLSDPATLASTDTVRHYLDASGGTPGAGAAYDSTATASGIVDGYGAHVVVLPAPVTARYWRFDISAASRVSAGFFDVGRAWAGPIYRPPIGVSVGSNYSWRSVGEIQRAARSPTTFADRVDPSRQIDLAFDVIDETDRPAWLTLLRRLSDHSQFVFCRDDDDLARETILAHTPGGGGIVSRAHAVSATRLQIVESL